jgi:glycosyltransferase involved in cell wall biosynthesis
VAASEVVPFIASADAGLVYYDRHNANYANALPNGFFQSLAAGLPLIYSDLPGMTEEAAPYDLGAPIAPRSAAAVAYAVRRLLDDAALRCERSEAARAFSTRVNFAKEEAILRGILDGVGVAGARSEPPVERPEAMSTAAPVPAAERLMGKKRRGW